jgi:ketosteroid isomerase-like protein
MISALAHLEHYAAAFSTDLAAAAARHYTDGVVMRVPGSFSGAGTAHGKDAVLAAHQALHHLTDGTAGPRQMLAALTNGDHALVRLRFGASRHRRALEWERTLLYRFEDELIAEIVIFDDPADQVEALLADGPHHN